MRQRRTLQILIWSQNTIIIVLFFPRLPVKIMIAAERKKKFQHYVAKKRFWVFEETSSNNSKITIIQHSSERYQNKSCSFAEKDGRFLSQH